MKFKLECQKIKRTGFLYTFIFGGFFAGAIPVLNMTVRAKMYVKPYAQPVEVLFDANWQVMALLNVLLVLEGVCILYNTEYADNAMQKMLTLPFKQISLFFNKFLLMCMMCFISFAIEAVAIAFCCEHWFRNTYDTAEICIKILKNFGYALLLVLPVTLLSLLIASLCKNIWISLGTGILCVFVATMLPTDNFVLSLFPFAMPFQIFAGTAPDTVRNFIVASIVELVLILLANLFILKIRRSFE